MAADPEGRAPLLAAQVQDLEALHEDGEASTVLVEETPEHWTRTAARQLYGCVSNLGTSVFFGILTAFGFKTIGQSVAIAIVLLFLGFQVLSYYGFINVSAVSGAVVRRFDLNGDGHINVKDVGVCCHRAGSWVLSWGLPSAFGFTVGFWFGWRIL